jgi:hypothetical protein
MSQAVTEDKVKEDKAVAKQPDRQKPKAMPTPLQATVELVRRGHRELLPQLRQLLKQQPDVFQYVGDLSRQAERAWLEMLGGEDDLLKESVVLYADELKKSLAGPNATPLERLTAERIAACWIEVEYHRAWLVQHPQADGSKTTQLHEKRFEAAHRRMERTMMTLASIKKLLPRTIEVQLLQKPTVTSPVESIIGSKVNGEQPPVSNGQATVQATAAMTTHTPINRLNGSMNGHHNRFAALEPTGAK